MDQLVFSAPNADQLKGSFSHGLTYGLAGASTIGNPMFGTPNADLLRGSFSNDIIYGLAGADTIFGSQGNDLISGGHGNDIIHGDQGNGLLSQDFGNDVLYGDSGTDLVTGGPGRDKFVLAPTSGGNTLSTADLITDFTKGTDLIGLAGRLRFHDLNFIRITSKLDPTGNFVNSTAIRDSLTGEYLAILHKVTPSQLEETDFTTDLNPIHETSPFGVALAKTSIATVSRRTSRLPDLTLTKASNVNSINAGDPITYTLTVRNNGNADAKNITVADILPAGFVPKTTTVSKKFKAKIVGQTVVFTGGKIGDGESATLRITVATNTATPGSITNTAIVDPLNKIVESNETNNRATATTQVNASTLSTEINVTDSSFGGTTDNIADGDTTPSTADGTNYGITTVGTAVTRTFTIQNTGTAALTLSAPTLPSGFSLVGAFPTSIAAGNNATFTVKLDAATVGTYSGNISFANNDSNENPYNFAIAGVVNAAAGPEINVTDGGFGGTTDNIADGDTTPSTTDGTDYGTTTIGTAVTRSFTIQNTGTALLTLSAPTLPSGFSLVGAFPTNIAAGNNATFTVKLDATATGNYSGNISFANNDSDENPYNFAIAGVVNPVPVPEINVTDGGFGGATDNIADGDTTPTTTDGTDYGATTVGTTATRTFTIENTGTSTLSLSAPTLPSGFSLVGAFPTSIAAGNNATFTVQLDAAAPGTYSGNISFANNDSDENPYTFAIAGVVNPVPVSEINVTDGGFGGATDNIVDGDTTPSVADGTDYGLTTVGSAVTRTFTIENTGTGALTLSAPTLPTGFSLVGAFPTSIAAGSNATFTVQLDATAPGTYNGNISFGNNDSDENPYNFAIAGVVNPVFVPEINVTDGGFGGTTNNIVDGDTTPSTADGTDYGSTTVGTAVTRTFTIENLGTDLLALSAPSLPAGFSLVGAFPTSVAAGDNATFTVQLDATAIGTYSGDISFGNNDSNESPYNFTVIGIVNPLPAPEINVTDGGFGGTTDNILDGDTTPSAADGTDYGSTTVGTAITRTFTIENTGTATLTLNTPAAAPGFSVIGSFPTSIAAGDNATFTVRLDATAIGTYSGEISFGNNDGDENPYNFAITGVVNPVPVPEINVTDGGFGGATNNILDGDTTPTTADGTDYGRTNVGTAITRTFTIENTGTAALTLNAPSLPSGFSLVGAFPTSITAGDNATFTVQLDATASGTYSGNISFANNDSDENPYDFAITGVVNAAPVLAAAAAGAIAIPEQTPTIISSTGLGITDDELNIESATIQITGNFQSGEDVISVIGALPSGISAGAFNTSTGTLTLTGSASLSSYTTALRQIAYTNTSNTPNTATRTVSFTVNDGDVNSNTVTRDITVQAVNDPPTLTPARTYTSNANLTLTVPDGATDLLTGATDPEGTAVSVVAATLTSAAALATATAADDNNVTVNADGSFVYRAVAGFVGNDTFTYQIQDSGTPLPAATTNVTATITVNDLDGAGAGNSVLWFIDEDATTSANLGTQANPFRSLAAFNAANTGAGNNPADSDVIFIDDDAGVDDNGDGAGLYAGGVTLRANQRLIGDGSSSTLAGITGITLGSFNSLDAFSSNRPTIVGGINLNSGNTLRGLNAGNASGFSINGGAVGNLTISEASVNNTTGGGFGIGISGALNVVLDSLSSTGGTNGVTLVGSTGTFTANGGTITSPTGVAFNINSGSVNATYSGNITQANNAAAVSIFGGHTGTATFQTGTISATNGTGLQFSNADGTYSFNGTTTLNGGDAGIDILTGSGGTFTFGSNTFINNPSGIAYNEDTSTANVTYNGTITKTNNANSAVKINAKTGGTTTFNGAITATTTTANAIDLTNNTGGTVNFTGGLTLNTTSGVGFNATGGGTVSATGAGSTIVSTTGTALNVVNTAIASSGLTFQSISANGAANGIVLNNTGANGGLTVTGGSTAASGGTIRNGATGISLTNTRNVSLNRMQLNDFSDFAIRGTSVVGFTMNNTVINGTNGNDVAADEGSVRFDELTGSASISNSSISGTVETQFRVTNTTGTLNRITFNNVTFGAMNAATGDDGLLIESLNNAVINATVQNSFFTAARGDHFQRLLNGSGASDLVFTGNTISNTGVTAAGGGGGIRLNGGNNTGINANATFDISNNTMRDSRGTALAVNKTGGTGTFSGTIANNTIGVAGVNNSGSSEGSGIFVLTDGGGSYTATITGNTVRQYSNHGIFMQAGGSGVVGNGTMILTVTGNTVTEPSALVAGNLPKNGIHLNAGTTPGDAYQITLTLGGAGALANNITGSGQESNPAAGTGQDFRLRQRQSTTVRLPGYAGANNDNAAVVAFVQGNNDSVSTPSGLASNTVPTGGGFVG
jgi:hypothetical protein